MSILGIDIGTTNCKGSVFRADGRRGENHILGRAEREYPLLHPRPGWAELDPRAVMSSVMEVIGELAGKAASDPIRAISVCSMGEAMTPVAADGRILGNAIIHLDARGREQIDGFFSRIAKEEYFGINPNIPGTNYSLPKLLWLKEMEGELYASAWKFLLFDALLFFKLGLPPLSSFSLVNRTMLFDIRAERWSERLLDLADIDPAKMGTPVPTGTIAGTIDSRTAAGLGLEAGVICVVGAHDQCCNALGIGAVAAGQAVCGIGTVECITPVYDRIPDSGFMLANGLNVEHHALKGLYVSFIYNQAGSLVRWFRDTFAKADVPPPGVGIYAALDRELPEDPTRLFVLPYFDPTGTPRFIENSSGLIMGLKVSTTRGEILKAIMECETLYFLESLRAIAKLGVDTSHFIATGGGARSSAWLQIKADVTGVPFERSPIGEAGTLGAAMIAGVATGMFPSYAETINRFVTKGEVFEPKPEHHAYYQEKYEQYAKIYPRVSDLLEWSSGA